MIAACPILSHAMQQRRSVEEPDGWYTRPGLGMLASDHDGRCSGDLPSEREIAMDPGEGFMAPSL